MIDSERVTLIKEKLTAVLTPTHLEVIDESQKHASHAGACDGGGHFIVTIVSPQFTEKTLIQRHRMVYAAIDELMKTAIHALSIHAQSPDEWNSK
jgi:BolA protein